MIMIRRMIAIMLLVLLLVLVLLLCSFGFSFQISLCSFGFSLCVFLCYFKLYWLSLIFQPKWSQFRGQALAQWLHWNFQKPPEPLQPPSCLGNSFRSVFCFFPHVFIFVLRFAWARAAVQRMSSGPACRRGRHGRPFNGCIPKHHAVAGGTGGQLARARKGLQGFQRFYFWFLQRLLRLAPAAPALPAACPRAAPAPPGMKAH